jgi:hypothetical protein
LQYIGKNTKFVPLFCENILKFFTFGPGGAGPKAAAVGGAQAAKGGGANDVFLVTSAEGKLAIIQVRASQGCQIFLGATYQNGKNIPNNHELSKKWPQNIPTSSIKRPYKIDPNWNFWFEDMPSGNPGASRSTEGLLI